METQQGIATKEALDLQSVDQDLVQNMVYDALVWSSLHGLVVGDRSVQRSGKVPRVGLVHAPFALLPMPFPESHFGEACELAPILNGLVDRVSLDGKFLQESLSRTKKVDTFTSRLLDIHSKVLELNKKEDMRMGLHRSDYMLDEQTKSLLQIEFAFKNWKFEVWQSVDQDLVQKMVYDALVWRSLHGLVVGDRSVQRSGKVPGVGLVHGPFALLPVSFPESHFREACAKQGSVNERPNCKFVTDPTHTTHKRKRMRAGRDKDEEMHKRKRGRFAPPILENTVSGAPECFAVNLKAVLFNCKALGLDFGSQTEEQSHEILALCKICMLPKIIQVKLFSRMRDIGTCDKCRQAYCVDIIAPGRELYMDDSINGKAVPIMYLRTSNLRTFVFKLRDSKWNVSLAGNKSVKITIRDHHRMEFESENLLGINSFYYRYADCTEFSISHMRVIFTQIHGLGGGA